jgi:hypothetical protein
MEFNSAFKGLTVYADMWGAEGAASLILKLGTRWAEWSASRAGRRTSAQRVPVPTEYKAECEKA